MRRKARTAVLCALFALLAGMLVLVGCAKEAAPVPEPTPSATATATPTPTSTPVPTPTPIPTWQEGYTDLLRQMPEGASCALLLIDEDEIPELWVNFYGYDPMALLCTYDAYTGEVIRQDLEPGHCRYALQGGWLMQIGSYAREGLSQERVTVRDGTIHVWYDEIVEDGEETRYYCYNKEVTEEEFFAVREEFKQGDLSYMPTKYSCEETIEQVLAWDAPDVNLVWQLTWRSTQVYQGDAQRLTDVNGDGEPELLITQKSVGPMPPRAILYLIDMQTRQIDSLDMHPDAMFCDPEQRLIYLRQPSAGKFMEYVYRAGERVFEPVWQGEWEETDDGVVCTVNGVAVTDTVYHASAAAAFPATQVVDMLTESGSLGDENYRWSNWSLW